LGELNRRLTYQLKFHDVYAVPEDMRWSP